VTEKNQSKLPKPIDKNTESARVKCCLSAVRPLMIIFISRVIYFGGTLSECECERASLSKSIIESLSISARAGPFLSISNSHNSRDPEFDQDARKLAINNFLLAARREIFNKKEFVLPLKLRKL